MLETVRSVRNQLSVFEREAHDLLGKHETAPSRVISLVATWKQLRGLSLLQNELFREALLAIERGLYRSAHVTSWAGAVDFLEEKLASDSLVKVHAARPNWSKFGTLDELRENIVEYQLIEVAKDIGLIKKPEMKALLGSLSRRNECAHPTGYDPGLNETLGYISELLNRIKSIQPRQL